MKARIKEFIQKYEFKIVLLVGFILVATISFEAGILKGTKVKEEPLTIETISCPAIQGAPSEAQNLTSANQNGTESVNVPNQDCAYVGSKNSDKYHLPNCRWAKQIKSENLTCFKDENEAKSKGYQADKNCIK